MVNNNKKMFAIRRKNGITRIVQVNKSTTGKNVYASDKRRCNGKTYRTKTMAKSALSKQKTPNSAFGRRSRSRSRRRSRRRSRKSKRFNFWNRYFVCRHPDDHTKIKVCKAANVRLRGEQYKLVQVQPKNVYGTEVVRRLTSDEHKLFKDYSRAKKYAKTLNVLELANIQEISELMPTEIFTDIKNAKRDSYRGVRPGKLTKYSTSRTDPNIFRSKFHRYDVPDVKQSVLRIPRKRSSSYRPKFLNIGRGGYTTGQYGPMGLYTTEGRRRLAKGGFLPTVPDYSGFGGRTNYGFSRYF